jgi:SAM-dependent methyltransferase
MNPKNYSMLRREQYKYLFQLKYEGKVLDLGGDTRNNYHDDLSGEHTIDIANLDPETGATLIFDFEKPFPIDSNTYQNIICLNVLEHVFEYNTVVSEAYRVLETGGKIVVSTPFLYRVHGFPDDFFRYTDSALVAILTQHGFKNIKVQPLGTGIFSVFMQHISGMIPTVFLRNIFRASAVGMDELCGKLMPRYREFAKQTCLGYFVTAEK